MTDFRGRLMVGVDGMEPTDQEVERLQSPLVGGCILFGKGYESAGQVAQLAEKVRRSAGQEIAIAVDHEGGRVQRFRGGEFTHLPAVSRLGRLYAKDPGAGLARAFDCGFVMAGELRRVGVDLSFAPVLDLDHGRSEVIGDRAFSSRTEEVARLAGAFARGMAQAGMRAVGKHFPGHGFCVGDSHVEYPVDSRRIDEILETDAKVYSPQGGAEVDAVMTAHVAYPLVDDAIATYSRRWLGDVLRGRVGFTGLAVSDDLCMAGAGLAGEMPARIRAAVAAGCDLALVCHRWDRKESEGALEFDPRTPNPWLALAPTAAPPAADKIARARARIAPLAHDA